MFEDETSKIVQRHVAMSRVGDTKQYVQDLLLKDQTFVYDVIANRKGQIYLCGKVIIFQRKFFFMWLTFKNYDKAIFQLWKIFSNFFAIKVGRFSYNLSNFF